MEQLQWVRTRRGDWPVTRIFAFDHRSQFEEMAGATPDKIGAFKQLCLQAAKSAARGERGYGILCDSRLGRRALEAASGQGLWIGRPVEWPGSRPLTLEPELGAEYDGLSDWPSEHVVKCLCFYHPDDTAQMRAQQEDTINRLFAQTRKNRLEFLLEVIPSKVGPVDDMTCAQIIQRFYDLDVFPDWWKLEPFRTVSAWQEAVEAIERNDPHTRGIVVLGLDSPASELFESFSLAARFDLVKGFAVGRTIFGDTARLWMSGGLSDADAVTEMAARFGDLCRVWDKARELARDSAA